MWTKGSSCITIELRDLLSHWRLVGLPDCPIMAISNLITPHTHSLQWSENPRVTREAMIEWKWNNDWVKVAILFYPSFKDKANVRHKMRRFLKIWEWREEKSRGEVLPPFNQKKKKYNWRSLTNCSARDRESIRRVRARETDTANPLIRPKEPLIAPKNCNSKMVQKLLGWRWGGGGRGIKWRTNWTMGN